MNDYTLDISDLSITQHAEGCKLTAYWDALGSRWSIGWAHTGPDVFRGLVWSQFKADSQLLVDMSSAEQSVKRLVAVAITRDQFVALCDFVYNLGCGNFESSTLLKDINSQQMTVAAKEFLRWDMAGGKVVPGLLTRREAEMVLFTLGTDYTASVDSPSLGSPIPQATPASVA